MTLAHQVVSDEFFNSFTYQNRKIRGSKEIRKIWLEIFLQIKQTQNKARVNARFLSYKKCLNVLNSKFVKIYVICEQVLLFPLFKFSTITLLIQGNLTIFFSFWVHIKSWEKKCDFLLNKSQCKPSNQHNYHFSKYTEKAF